MAEVLGIASGVIAVVGMSAQVLTLCFQYSQQVKHARDDIERLRKEVAAFQSITEQLGELIQGPRGQELEASQQLVSTIKHGYSTLEKLAQELQPSTGRDTMRRFGLRALKWPFKSKEVEEIMQRLSNCRGNILLALNVDQTAILQNVDHKIALDMLPIAGGASFDSRAEEHNPTCLANTRVELLKEIDRWIDDPNSATIFWLKGMAGTGKSTISRTVARSRSEKGDLGASFFFKRGETDRGNLAKFVPTIARRLARSIPETALFIKSAIDTDPAIVDKTVREQFEKLVQEPLSEAAAIATPSSRSAVVIVVDALDECETDADIRLLVALFSNVRLAGSLRVRVLITSRPELPVRLGFRSIEGTYQDLILHEIPRPIIEHDIAAFLRHEFANIRDNFNKLAGEELKLSVDWPEEGHLLKLTTAASPLFIFAATLCRFINDSCLGSPDELLRKVLCSAGRDQASKLDMAYRPVLEQQVIKRLGRERRDVVESFRLVVGSIITLASPLSKRTLALLLDVDVNKVTTRLTMLHSVLKVPEALELPVRLFHLSFRDYLIDPENRETLEFWVDEKLAHRNLANQCLCVMRGALRENICGLSFPGMRRSSVDRIQLDRCISPELQYASMYWVYHQTKVDYEPNDDQEVYEFLTIHFLHWLEALSLLGRAEECLDTARSLIKWRENRGDSTLSHFLADAIRFLQAYLAVINEAPLQLYSSALAFAPERSIIRNTFKHCIPEWLVVWPQVKQDWDACLLTLEGHSDLVNWAVFSHDSMLVASTSSDETVRIWDVKTGQCRHVLEGHSGEVELAVFSHNSALVATASLDKTVRLWHTDSGQCKHILEIQSEDVSSVAFSHDSLQVALVYLDMTAQIWDVKTGQLRHTMGGDDEAVYSVAFLDNSALVASGSDHEKVHLWCVDTGKYEYEHELSSFNGNTESVVFSYDSLLVALVSSGGVAIWDVKTGECRCRWVIPDGSLGSVVFSYDLVLVATVTDDELRLFYADTAECKHILRSHAGDIEKAIFSYDSLLLALAPSDRTIQIWDVEMGYCKYVLESYTYPTVFSYDSLLFASIFAGDTIRIWDVKTREHQIQEGHRQLVRSVDISHDTMLILSASQDLTLRIWNAKTGQCKHVLRGHTADTKSAVFSYDSTLAVSGSFDSTVRIWDVEKGQCKHVLEGHSDYILSAVFSHDTTLVASASGDHSVRIWSVETGQCRHVIRTDDDISALRFAWDDGSILTKAGEFAFDGKRIPPPPKPPRLPLPSALSLRNNTWVTMAGKDLLWLPVECRRAEVAVLAYTVAIGCESGRVIGLGFSAAEIAGI